MNDMRETLVQGLLTTQRDMLALNKAKTEIRQVLPASSPAALALEEEILKRFRAIQSIRKTLNTTEAGNAQR